MKKEEVLKFYQTYKIFIFPSVVALSALILIVFVIFPQINKLLSNQKASGDDLEKLKFLEVKAQALEKYDEQDLSNKVEYTLSSYPVDKDFASVTGFLQNIVAKSGFSITSLNLGSSSSSVGNSQSYSLKLEITGPASSVSTLLNNIENSSRLMRVQNMEITVGTNAQESIVSLDVEVLYSPAPQAFGSVDSPVPELTSKDEEILARLSSTVVRASQPDSSAPLGPRGKSNPFE